MKITNKNHQIQITAVATLLVLLVAVLGMVTAHYMMPPQTLSIVPGRDVNQFAKLVAAMSNLLPAAHHWAVVRIVLYALATVTALTPIVPIVLLHLPQRVLASGWRALSGRVETITAFVRANVGMLLFFALLGSAGWSGMKLATNHATIITVCEFTTSCALLAVQTAVAVAHLRLAGIVSAVAGILMLWTGMRLLDSRAEQIEKYNQAMVALDRHDLAGELKLLDESSQAYMERQSKSQLYRLIFGEPSVSVEARAQFHKGVALFLQDSKKNGKDAAAQFWKSLRLNPGNLYAGLATAEAEQRYDDALNAKFNMEILQNSGASNGKAKGKEGDQAGQGQQPQGDHQLNDPSKQAGKQANDTL